MGRRKNTLGPHTHHSWDKNRAILYVARNSDGTEVIAARYLDFEELGIARGGLLEAVIRNAPCPLDASKAGHFMRAITSLSADRGLCRILESPTENLGERDIISLARFIDEDVLKWKRQHPYDLFVTIWSIFKKCKSRIRTGQQVSEVYYRPQYSGYERLRNYLRSRGKYLISDGYDSSFDDPELAAPISALSYDSPNDLTKAATRHLKGRLDRIESVCLLVVERHIEIVEYLNSFKGSSLPDSVHLYSRRSFENGGLMHVESLQSLPPEDRLQVYLCLIERDRWFEHRPNLSYVRLKDHAMLAKATPKETQQELSHLILSNYFMPGHVVIACLILVAIATGWNKSTLYNLSLENVIKTSYGYELSAVKRKTDKIQAKTILEDFEEDCKQIEIRSITLCQIIDLLCKNARAIETYGMREGDSLFLIPTIEGGDKPWFRFPTLTRNLNELCAHVGVTRFTIKQIRDQVAALQYVSNECDPFIVSANLGHSSVQITEENYLALTILRALNEANLRRFMVLLEKSLRYAIDRIEPDAERTKDFKTIKRLLFPVSHLGDDSVECAADQWINSGGEVPLEIGADEVRHCALQRKYYLDFTEKLIQSNPERFLRRHLPRIVICYALYQLIEGSPYRSVLRRYEEKLSA